MIYVSIHLILTLPAISLSCGCAAWMILCALFVVDVVRPVVVWIGVVLCDGDAVFGRCVADGFAWPFLVGVNAGTIGLRGIILSFIVGITSSSSDSSVNGENNNG